MRNHGCWNCRPQPTACPVAFSRTSAPASSQKENRMPAAAATNPARTARRSPPPWPTTASSFIDKTGRTQGIRLRMSPPRNARPSIAASRCLPSATTLAPGEAAAVAPIVALTVPDCSRERSPSITVSVSGRPRNGRFSPSPLNTATVREAVRRSSDIATAGAPKASGGCASTKTSGAASGSAERSATTNFGSLSSPLSPTPSTVRPCPWPGTSAPARAMSWANADGRASPAGRSSASSAT